jgi:hypothetical protein
MIFQLSWSKLPVTQCGYINLRFSEYHSQKSVTSPCWAAYPRLIAVQMFRWKSTHMWVHNSIIQCLSVCSFHCCDSLNSYWNNVYSWCNCLQRIINHKAHSWQELISSTQKLYLLLVTLSCHERAPCIWELQMWLNFSSMIPFHLNMFSFVFGCLWAFNAVLSDNNQKWYVFAVNSSHSTQY